MYMYRIIFPTPRDAMPNAASNASMQGHIGPASFMIRDVKSHDITSYLERQFLHSPTQLNSTQLIFLSSSNEESNNTQHTGSNPKPNLLLPRAAGKCRRPLEARAGTRITSSPAIRRAATDRRNRDDIGRHTRVRGDEADGDRWSGRGRLACNDRSGRRRLCYKLDLRHGNLRCNNRCLGFAVFRDRDRLHDLHGSLRNFHIPLARRNRNRRKRNGRRDVSADAGVLRNEIRTDAGEV
jgi:hypothetical protein